MPLRARLVSLWRNLIRRQRVERELEAELASYVDLLTAEKVKEGMPPDDARRAALIEVGGVTQVKEAVRRTRFRTSVDSFARDLRYGARALRRSPGFTLVSIGILALGISANASIITAADVLLHPPGVPDGDRLAAIRLYRGERGSPSGQMSANLGLREYLEFRARQRAFDDVAGEGNRQMVIDVDASPTAARVSLVTGTWFQVMRPPMALGTGFPPAPDADAQPEQIAVVSHPFWRARFGGSRSVIGRTLRVNQVTFTIVGVLPEYFRYARDVIVPLSAASLIVRDPRDAATIGALVGRLAPGVTPEQATAATSSVIAGIGGAYSWRDSLTHAVVYPLHGLEPGFPVLLAASAGAALPLLVLIIACANVSVLLLGRAVTRRHEVAVRLTLGAGRGRIIRQLLTESALLAVAAGVVGLAVMWAVGWWLTATLASFDFPFTPSWRVIGSTLALAAGTGVLFSLAPAAHATRAALADALRDPVITLDRRRARLQRAFVVAEVALSTALVCAAGLYVQALRAGSKRVDVGHEISDSIATFPINLSLLRFPQDEVERRLTILRDRIASRPDVEGASLSNDPPFSRLAVRQWAIPLDDASAGAMIDVEAAHVDVDYFAVLALPLLSGRGFVSTDAPGALPVAVVSEAVARQRWPGESALGKTLSLMRRSSPDRPAMRVTVVGVAGEVRNPRAIDRIAPPIVYLPRRQAPGGTYHDLIVRTRGDAGAAAPSILREIWSVDPDLPIGEVLTLADRYDRVFSEPFWQGMAGTAVGILALGLACVGVFAVISFGVAQRAREIGIRLALGARSGQVVGLFFRDGMRLALLGLMIGVPVALIVMRVTVTRVEGGVELLRASAIGLVAAVLLIVSALASWLPARRAANVDPLDAIRSE